MRYIMLLFWLVLIALGVAFSVVNASSVTVNFYISSYTIYLPLLFLILLAIGFVLGLLAMLRPLVKIKMKNRQLLKKIKGKSQEVKNLQRIAFKENPLI